MNKLTNLALGLAAVFFVVIAATGIDVISSRTGVGLLGLGVGVFLVSISGSIRPWPGSRPLLTIMTLLGSAYFIGRGLLGGPIGLAVHDVALVLSGVGIYLAVISSSKGGRSFWFVLLALLGLVNVALAISQSASEDPFSFWKTGEFTTGLFAHYNAFASFMNGTAFFFLSFALFGRNLVARLAYALLSVGLIVSLLISESRGGWVSFVAGGVVWMIVVVLFLKQRRSKYLGIVSIMAVVLGVGGIVSSVWMIKKITERRAEKVEQVVNYKPSREVNDGGRWAMQQMGFEVFLDSPVVGGGSRAFSYQALERWDADKMELWMGDPEFAHNEFVQLLSDYGLVGFVVVLALFFLHGVLGVMNLVNEDDQDSGLSIWQLGAAGGLVAMLCQSYFPLSRLCCFVCVSSGDSGKPVRK